MTDHAIRRMHGHVLPDDGTIPHTLVELTWIAQRIEHAIRFGRKSYDHVIDRRRSVVGFEPGSIFAFVRRAGNEHGPVIARIDIVRAVAPGEPYQTLPFVRPGGALLLRLNGWPNVAKTLRMIDAIEALGIDPVDVAPEYWLHVHNRLLIGHTPRAYTSSQHSAWLQRRRIGP